MNRARPLGLVSATALVVANMIGTGVFTTSGFLLRDLGSPWAVLLAWVGGGLLAALGAVSYGALARRFPESGGEYLFLARTVHPAAGYVAGWISLLVGFAAPCAAVAFAFGEYVKGWWPGLAPKVVGGVLLIFFSVVHSVGVRGGAWIQNTLVVAKILLIGAFVAFGWSHVRPAPPVALPGASWTALGLAVVWVSFSYSGWNAAVYVGGEVAAPDQNLPRALLLGTGIVTGLYLALHVVFLFAVPPEVLAGQLEVGRLAAGSLGGPRLAGGVTGLIALALATSASSMIMAGPRVYARMAADGCLPRWFATAAGPPRRAIALQGAVALLLLWLSAYESLLTYIGFTLGLCAAGAVAGLMRLRRREGARLWVPGWPVVPALFVVAVAAVALASILRQPGPSAWGLITLGLPLVLWRLTARKAGGA